MSFVNFFLDWTDRIAMSAADKEDFELVDQYQDAIHFLHESMEDRGCRKSAVSAGEEREWVLEGARLTSTQRWSGIAETVPFVQSGPTLKPGERVPVVPRGRLEQARRDTAKEIAVWLREHEYTTLVAQSMRGFVAEEIEREFGGSDV